MTYIHSLQKCISPWSQYVVSLVLNLERADLADWRKVIKLLPCT
jgi:hypothetical protein